MNEVNYKRLAAAVINQAYTDIRKLDHNKFKSMDYLCNQLAYARSAARFLSSEDADFYRSFFQGE